MTLAEFKADMADIEVRKERHFRECKESALKSFLYHLRQAESEAKHKIEILSDDTDMDFRNGLRGILHSVSHALKIAEALQAKQAKTRAKSTEVQQ